MKIDLKKLNIRKISRTDDLIVKNRISGPRIVVTEELAKKIVERVHVQFGHLGMSKMITLISKQYQIAGLSQLVKKYVQKCDTCIRNKSRLDAKLGHLSRLGPAERPYQIMSIDTVGGLTGANSTTKCMHILIDHFTRFVWIQTSSTQTAKNFINLIHPVKDKGIETILADQYTGINSREFKQFVKNSGANLVFTSVDCAQSNRMNERVNQTIMNRLRCKFDGEGERAWTTVAKEVVREYNRTLHSSTGFAPEFLLHGKYDCISPIDKPIELEEARRQALIKSNCSFNRNKSRYDRQRKNIELKEGDLVYISTGNKLNRHKLDNVKAGPYRVIKKVSNSMYQIEVDKKRKESVLFNVSKLFPFVESEEGRM